MPNASKIKPQKTKPTKAVPQEVIMDLPWGGLTAVGLTLVTFFLSGLIGSFYTWFYTNGIHHWNATQANQWLNNSVIGQFIYSVIVYGAWMILLILFLAFYGFWKKKGTYLFKQWRSVFRVIGWKKPKWHDLAYALSGFALYFITFVIVIAILNRVFPSFNANQQQDVGFQSSTHGPILILVFLSLVFIPPFVEETVFRGFLFTGLKKSLPVVWAAIFTSVLFAIPHLFEGTGGKLLVVGGVDTFILSLVLVYLRQHTDSLWPSIGLHMLKNGVAFASLFFFAHIFF